MILNIIFVHAKAILFYMGLLAETNVVKEGGDGQLSATAYVILAVVFLGLVMGLGWCFYRAVRETDKSAEPQLPDEVGDEQQD
jgi:hypothetical protein